MHLSNTWFNMVQFESKLFVLSLSGSLNIHKVQCQSIQGQRSSVEYILFKKNVLSSYY